MSARPARGVQPLVLRQPASRRSSARMCKHRLRWLPRRLLIRQVAMMWSIAALLIALAEPALQLAICARSRPSAPRPHWDPRSSCGHPISTPGLAPAVFLRSQLFLEGDILSSRPTTTSSNFSRSKIFSCSSLLDSPGRDHRSYPACRQNPMGRSPCVRVAHAEALSVVGYLAARLRGLRRVAGRPRPASRSAAVNSAFSG